MPPHTSASPADAIQTLYGARIATSRSLSGGCIAESQHLRLDHGQELFLKQGGSPAACIAEADGLAALAAAGLPVPTVVAHASPSASRGFLLLSYHPSGRPDQRFWQAAGEALAACHEQDRGPAGWPIDNLIGASVQINRPAGSWPEFFAERRLAVQLDLVGRAGLAESWLISGVEALIRRCPELLPADEALSLVHGDLWSGNLLCTTEGTPIFMDPAVAIGHHEVDLAMTELFGGFAPDFYAAYHACTPRQPGYAQRKACYNCYHMLNHVTLFGSGYLGSVRALLRQLGVV